LTFSYCLVHSVLNDEMNKWVEQKITGMNGRRDEWMNEWMRGWEEDWIDEWITLWVEEYKNKWIIKWMDE